MTDADRLAEARLIITEMTELARFVAGERAAERYDWELKLAGCEGKLAALDDFRRIAELAHEYRKMESVAEKQLPLSHSDWMGLRASREALDGALAAVGMPVVT